MLSHTSSSRFTFLLLLLTSIFSLAFTMSLKPRDAIHPEDIERYDAMATSVSDSQFLHLYLENDQVKLDVREHPSNDIVRSSIFRPSEQASKFFQQESERDKEFFADLKESDMVQQPRYYSPSSSPSSSESQEKAALKENAPPGSSPANNRAIINRFRRSDADANSGCYQFCGRVAHCTDRRCPHCYCIGGNCLWQKRCR